MLLPLSTFSSNARHCNQMGGINNDQETLDPTDRPSSFPTLLPDYDMSNHNKWMWGIGSPLKTLAPAFTTLKHQEIQSSPQGALDTESSDSKDSTLGGDIIPPSKYVHLSPHPTPMPIEKTTTILPVVSDDKSSDGSEQNQNEEATTSHDEYELRSDAREDIGQATNTAKIVSHPTWTTTRHCHRTPTLYMTLQRL